MADLRPFDVLDTYISGGKLFTVCWDPQGPIAPDGLTEPGWDVTLFTQAEQSPLRTYSLDEAPAPQTAQHFSPDSRHLVLCWHVEAEDHETHLKVLCFTSIGELAQCQVS